jgi:hypothetical protein
MEKPLTDLLIEGEHPEKLAAVFGPDAVNEAMELLESRI